MTREALDGDDLEARSGDGHNRAAGKEDTPSHKGKGIPETHKETPTTEGKRTFPSHEPPVFCALCPQRFSGHPRQ
ncbi:hypothetical protein [Nocardiopsis oceani]